MGTIYKKIGCLTMVVTTLSDSSVQKFEAEENAKQTPQTLGAPFKPWRTTDNDS